MKFFKPNSPKESNKNVSFFGCKSRILHQRFLALSDLFAFEIMNGSQASLFSYEVMKIYKIIDFIRRKNTIKISLKFSITTFFNKFFISKLDI